MNDSMGEAPRTTQRPSAPEAIQRRQGHLSEAERLYAALCADDHGQFDALHLFGLARYRQGRLVEALQLIAAALKAKPDSPDALSNYGLVLAALARHEEALDNFDKAIALDCDHANALNNRGLTLVALGRTVEALASWDRALEVDPNHCDALHSRGNALYDLKCFGAALADYERVLTLRPDNLDVLNNRGGALAGLGRLDEALDSYNRALSIAPTLPVLQINKGHVLADQHRFELALSSYAEAAAAETMRPEAKWFESLVRLRLGQFAQGWRDFEWRWQQTSWAPQRRNFIQRLWLGGKPLAGQTILLHAEQGFGDTIQFVRYAKLVAGLGPIVLLEAQSPLKLLLSSVDGVAQTLARGEPLPPFDLHCPLMSLPLAFGTTLGSIPAEVPYLHAPADRLAQWRSRLGEKKSLRIGIAWAGSAQHKNNHQRSIALDRFAALLAVPGIEFVSVQKDISPTDAAALSGHANIIHIGDELHDFSDTAAVISLLDLVVSADTAVAHLTGALGRPVWVLVPFSPDFRWLLGREDSPWYPTARVFRQPRLGDWESVIARVHDELERLAAASESSATGHWR
jgi:tetratricopeptide (TPR) repeat protein